MKISEVKNLPKIAAPGGRVVAEVSPEFLKEKGYRYSNLRYRTE